VDTNLYNLLKGSKLLVFVGMRSVLTGYIALFDGGKLVNTEFCAPTSGGVKSH